ncbi:MAG TPA: DUF2270 domain-containing protein [Thermoflexia bacterium]|nr:DUF2270 domain-containing protein [Thermoflexia bacterium]
MPPAEENLDDTVWTYQGYRLKSPQFATAMTHLYRAEIQRVNFWRNRLDTTTNWAVVTEAAALTFVFGSPGNPHFSLLLVLVLLLAFLNIEARRYRYYELWYRRSRLLETNYFAAMMSPPYLPAADWAAQLEKDLLYPAFRTSWWEAIAHRFRRNYLWMITLLLSSWVIKLNIHPTPTTQIEIMITRATIGQLIPGKWIIVGVVLIYALLLILTILATIPPEKRAILKYLENKAMEIESPLLKPRPVLVTIITNEKEKLAAQIIKVLGRGVTSLEGTGMYTGHPKGVLISVLTEVQLPQLKQLVRSLDPHAFVVINQASEVQGYGFSPLETPL